MGFFLLFLCCCGESLVLVYCLCCCCGHYLHISEAFLIASYLSASVVLCKSDRGWTKTQLAASYIDNAARQDGIRPWNVTKTREKERSKKKESVYGTKPTTQGPLPNAAIRKKNIATKRLRQEQVVLLLLLRHWSFGLTKMLTVFMRVFASVFCPAQPSSPL